MLEQLRAGALPGAQPDERDIRAHALRCERLVAALARSVGTRTRPRVLEVGIGSGYVIAAVRGALGERVRLYAVEHPARALPHHPEFDSYLRERGVVFESADLLAGPLAAFPGIAFDAVICSEVIEHLPPDAVASVLTGLAGRLAGGGALVLSSPNLRSFHRRASLAAGGGRIFDLPLPLADADGTYGHLRLYAKGEIEELLAHGGLQLAHWEYVNFEAEFVDGRALRSAQKLLPRVLPSLSSGWLAVAGRRE